MAKTKIYVGSLPIGLSIKGKAISSFDLAKLKGLKCIGYIETETDDFIIKGKKLPESLQ